MNDAFEGVKIVVAPWMMPLFLGKLCHDVVFPVQGVLLVVQGDLGAAVFWEEYLVSDLDAHGHVLAVGVPHAGTGGHHGPFQNLGLSLFWDEDSPLGLGHSLSPLHQDAVQHWDESLEGTGRHCG